MTESKEHFPVRGFLNAEPNRGRLVQHIVVPDTNILFSPDLSKAGNSQLETLLKSHYSERGLTLAVLQLVRDERVFQVERELRRKLRQLGSGITSTEKFLGRQLDIGLPDIDCNAFAKGLVGDWIASHNGSIEPIPTEKIDWARMVTLSVERLPPFKDNGDANSAERGFRDAVIAESVLAFADKIGEIAIVSFVSGDALLRQYLSGSPGKANLLLFESLEGFQNYFNAEITKSDAPFATAIWKHATSWFLELYKSAGIYSRILTDFEAEFDKLRPNTKLRIATSLPGVTDWWVPITGMQQLIMPPTYLGTGQNGEIKWASTLRFAMAYKYSPFGIGTAPIYDPRGLLVELIFEIQWHASVSDRGALIAAGVDGIELKNSGIRVPSNDDCTLYEIPDSNGLTNYTTSRPKSSLPAEVQSYLTEGYNIETSRHPSEPGGPDRIHYHE